MTAVLFTAAKVLGLVGIVLWFFGTPAGRVVGRLFPAPFWVYFLSILASTFGFFPSQSPVYSLAERYVLPMAIILMLIGTPLTALARLGPKAALAMLLATGSIFIATLCAYTLFSRVLPEEGWKASGALLGTWTGGSANMISVKQILGLTDDGLSPLIVVDTVLSYLWLALLLLGSAWQKKFDRQPETVEVPDRESVEGHIEIDERIPRHLFERAWWWACLAGFAALASIGAVEAGRRLNVSLEFLSTGAWAVLIASTGSLILALSPLRRLETIGASRLGGIFLYVVLVTIGAKTNLFSVKGVPIYLAFGLAILVMHGVLLLIIGRFLRIPVFLLATASQANIGGAVSAPIVATIYRKGTAHLGVLMAILGAVLGTYIGILGGWLCHFVARGAS